MLRELFLWLTRVFIKKRNIIIFLWLFKLLKERLLVFLMCRSIHIYVLFSSIFFCFLPLLFYSIILNVLTCPSICFVFLPFSSLFFSCFYFYDCYWCTNLSVSLVAFNFLPSFSSLIHCYCF